MAAPSAGSGARRAAQSSMKQRAVRYTSAMAPPMQSTFNKRAVAKSIDSPITFKSAGAKKFSGPLVVLSRDRQNTGSWRSFMAPARNSASSGFIMPGRNAGNLTQKRAKISNRQ